MLEVMFKLLVLVLLVLHAQQSPFFVYIEACCLLLFAKVENFVKFTLIYIIQIYFSTLLHLILALYYYDFAFPVI